MSQVGLRTEGVYLERKTEWTWFHQHQREVQREWEAVHCLETEYVGWKMEWKEYQLQQLEVRRKAE